MTLKCSIEQKKIWIISDGHIGRRAQCLGLIQALHRISTLSQPVYDLKITLPTSWSWIPARWQIAVIKASGDMSQTRFLDLCSLLSEQTSLPKQMPDLMICCGRRTIAPVLAFADFAQKQGKLVQTIYLQDPKYGYDQFDVILPPEHDVIHNKSLHCRQNVIATLGAIHRIDVPTLVQAKRDFSDLFAPIQNGPNLAVLLGGPNKKYRFPKDLATRWGHLLGQYAQTHQGRLLITASRRTPTNSKIAFRTACLAKAPNSYIWDEHSQNPYLGMLAWADAIILTNDSVNMISEACATGKPVFMLSLAGAYPKFDQFHKTLIAQQRLFPVQTDLPIPDQWSIIETLDEPTRIAKKLIAILQT